MNDAEIREKIKHARGGALELEASMLLYEATGYELSEHYSGAQIKPPAFEVNATSPRFATWLSMNTPDLVGRRTQHCFAGDAFYVFGQPQFRPARLPSDSDPNPHAMIYINGIRCENGHFKDLDKGIGELQTLIAFYLMPLDNMRSEVHVTCYEQHIAPNFAALLAGIGKRWRESSLSLIEETVNEDREQIGKRFAGRDAQIWSWHCEGVQHKEIVKRMAGREDRVDYERVKQIVSEQRSKHGGVSIGKKV